MKTSHPCPLTTLLLALLTTTVTTALPSPSPMTTLKQQQQRRQQNTTITPPSDDCPQIHIFAARETTAPPEFGSSRTLVDLILGAFPGPSQATVEAIDYPAAGLTLDEYAASVTAGIAAVVDQTGAFAARCPGSVIVMHGYSQVWKCRVFFSTSLCLSLLSRP